MAKASKRETKRVAAIFATQRKDMMTGAAAGMVGGLGVGIYHRQAKKKGWKTVISPNFKLGWATLGGLAIAGAGLWRRRRWSVPVAMAGTSIAAADLAISAKDVWFQD